MSAAPPDPSGICERGEIRAACLDCLYAPQPYTPRPKAEPATRSRSSRRPDRLSGTKDVSVPVYDVDTYIDPPGNDWLIAQGFAHDLRPGGFVYLRQGDALRARARVRRMEWRDGEDRPWRTGDGAAAGEHAEDGWVFVIDPGTWERVEFPLGELPDPIGRPDVAALGASAAQSTEDAERAFVASMVWGFSPTGYAVYRTNRILKEDPDAATKLQAIAQAVAEDGPVEGRRAMANTRYIKWFDPAFGTEYLAFCSRPDSPALILDALVATWMNEHCGTALRPTRWPTAQYEEYLANMAAWSARRCTPTELETLVFVEAASRREGSQWASSTGRRP